MIDSTSDANISHICAVYTWAVAAAVWRRGKFQLSLIDGNSILPRRLPPPPWLAQQGCYYIAQNNIMLE